MAEARSRGVLRRRRVVRSVDPERFEVRLMPESGGGQPELLATAGTAGGARLAARTIAVESGLPRRRIAIYDTRLERSLTRKERSWTR